MRHSIGYRSLALAAAVAAMAGCSSTVVRENGASTRPGPPRVSTPKPGATTLVQRGDTLYSIATRNGISVLDLASWNALAPPYTIYPGQRLYLYPGGTRTAPVSPRPPGGIATPPREARPLPPPVVVA
ncbi:MAG TPA: LysM peptidoglycan-binding domain-containing protein, partial [Lysobacter sp.]